MTDLKLIVKQVRQEALDVRSFELVAADAKPLPTFTPGSHIDVEPAPGSVRTYSLCNGSGRRGPDAGPPAARFHDRERGARELSLNASLYLIPPNHCFAETYSILSTGAAT